MNPDGTNKGFGYIQFVDKDSAKACLDEMKDTGTVSIYQAHDASNRVDPAKNVNQVYFNFVPLDMTEEEIKPMFEPFGDVKSFIMNNGYKG